MKKSPESLLHDWLHGEISAEDFERLQEMLRGCSELRKRLRHEVNLDLVLRDHACLDASLRSWIPDSAQDNKILMPVRFLQRPRVAWAAAAALAAMLAAGLFIRFQTNPVVAARQEEMNQGSAILTRVMNATWQNGGSQPRSGDTLGTGLFQLAGGLAQIEFFSGATLLVDGPAELEILSPWEARCHSGKIRLRVPPPARGFKIHTPEMQIEDLGTEFAVEVDPEESSTEVHVFEGEVHAQPTDSDLVVLHDGEGLRRCPAGLKAINTVRPEDFICLERMDAMTQSRAKSRFSAWKEWKKQYCEDDRVLASYTFQRSCNWERAAGNDASTTVSFCTGGIVGARWTQGRWPEKDALEFKRPGDRVRIRLSGVYEGLTFACWIKVDGLDRKYNALLLTDGYEPGEPHWQILEDGRVMFSVAYAIAPDRQEVADKVYYTPVIFNHSNLGRWHHLAVTYDAVKGETTHYFDGKQVSRETLPDQQRRHVIYGSCEIGNWGLPAEGHEFPVRNLNGCIDEFVIYKLPLQGTEMVTLYQAGKQD